MNNEDFDEAIRKKLESLNQTYTGSEIDKVYRHVKGKRRFPLKGSTGSWLMYSLSAAAFTVVTVWSVSHFQENRQVTIQKNKITKQLNINASDTNSLNTPPQDTVTFKITESKVVDSLPVGQAAIAYTHSNIENKVTRPETASAPPVKAEPAKSIPVTTRIGNESVITLGLDKAPATAIAIESATNSSVNKDIVSVKPDSIIVSETQVSTQLSAAPQAMAPVVIAEIIADAKKDELTKVPDTPKHEKTAETVKSSDSASIGKGVQIRVGADFQLSNQSFGMGVTGEMLFINHFGIETGLIYRMYQAVQFPDKNALFTHQHHDSNHGIDNHFQGKDHIRDVSIENRTLEIPIIFKYYVPLKKNFSVSFSLGTSLDIYLNQKISYTYRADSGMMDNGNFNSKGNVVPFNNIVISAALEKEWKSWSVHLQPYMAPRVKEVFYKPEELEFGVGVGVKYSFGK